jgi:hypothetical protein
MQITAVDNELNLFCVTHAVPDHLVKKILDTDWPNLPWDRQPGQESWPRRRIRNQSLPWIQEWDNYFHNIWPTIQKTLGVKLHSYCGTAFWLDEPGFVCYMHTDGEMPGSLQLVWQGSGTTFYWHNNTTTLRYQVPSEPNNGYVMLNTSDSQGCQPLIWHAMLDPVPTNSFRVTSYTWITIRHAEDQIHAELDKHVAAAEKISNDCTQK